MNKILSIISVLLVVLIIPSSLWAKDKGLNPQASVEQLLGEISQIKTGENVSQQEKADNDKHSKSALTMLNVAEISKKALGKHWAKQTEADQERFRVLLGDLFVHVAFPSSGKFFAALELMYGETREKKNLKVVPLTVIHKEEGEVGIDFHLIQAVDKWQVVDVILDGASMRNNLRSKFYKIVSKKGINELIKKMEKKLANAKS